MEQGTPGVTYGSGFWSGPIKITTAMVSDWPKPIHPLNGACGTAEAHCGRLGVALWAYGYGSFG